MSIKLTDRKRPFAFNGTAYMTPRTINSPWKVAHEMKHIEQQGTGFFRCSWWVGKYFAFKSFRRRMEIEAFIAEALAGGIQNYTHFQEVLITKYWGAFTLEQAENLVAIIKEKRGEN